MSVVKGVIKGSLVGSDLTLPGPGADQWQEVGQVQSLYIYPVKSMAPVKMDSFSVEKTGPRYGFIFHLSFRDFQVFRLFNYQKWAIGGQTVYGC